MYGAAKTVMKEQTDGDGLKKRVSEPQASLTFLNIDISQTASLMKV